MGNFLLVIAERNFEKYAEGIFRKGLQLASELKGLQKADTLIRPNLMAAAFSKQNGSGGEISRNRETGDWVLSIGTWTHPEVSDCDYSIKLSALVHEKGVLPVARGLEGFFVIAGGNDKETFVLTDIIGSCHAFCRSWNGVTAISSSSLLLAALGERNIDCVACQEFILGGVIYEDRTLFREVCKLHPATHYCYANGRLSKQECYWPINKLQPESLSGNTAVDALKSAIQTAATKIGTLAPRLLCDLTGGYDSRTLVAGFLSIGQKPAATVSGSADSADVLVSVALANLADLPHIHSNPEPIHSFDQIRKALELTDGEYDILEYARVRESHQKLTGRFDITLNGSFGEVARGYWWEILVPHVGKKQKLDSRKAARLRYLPRGFDASLFPSKQRINLEEHYADIIERTNTGLEDSPNTFQLDNVYLKLRMQRWQGRIASSTNQIWPCLSPFIFRSVLEVMLQTKHDLRRRSLLIRKLLPKLDSRFAQYPLEHGFPPLPVNIRTIHRFWPIVSMYGRKAKNRLKRLGKHVATSTGPTSSSSRLLLWQDPEIRGILQADRMLSTIVLDGDALTDFLRRSRQSEFPHEGQWARVLTLECALRSLKEAQRIHLT
jgi:hypothetical protein